MFGYKCSECGEGTVREKTVLKYQTKVMGYPFVVDAAKLGVCDRCGAEHFAARETKRWEGLFEHSLAENRLFLLPKDIANLRQELGLSMEQFAMLVGCTRQSLHNWEKTDRARPQSRTVDLLMKLVDKGRTNREVNVIQFLVEEAKKLGIEIRLRRMDSGEPTALPELLILQIEQIVEQSWAESEPEEIREYVAQNETGQAATVAKTPDGNRVGKLIYEFLTGNIVLELEADDWDLRNYYIELVTNTGERVEGEPEHIEERKIILLKNSDYTDKEIKEVHLIRKSS